MLLGEHDAHKQTIENTRFFGWIAPNDVLYSCFEGIY